MDDPARPLEPAEFAALVRDASDAQRAEGLRTNRETILQQIFDAMPEHLALHIPRCRSVHTFTMRFPLDLIWLDKAGHVVRVDPGVPPRRMKSCLRARSVIEARAGTADAFLAAGLVAT